MRVARLGLLLLVLAPGCGSSAGGGGAVDAAPAVDSSVQAIDSGAATVDARVTAVDARVTAVDARVVAVDAGGGTIDGSVGLACGGRGTAPCSTSAYCDWADDSCGATDLSGSCTMRPVLCPDVVQQVCACDGKVYSNSCEAARAGFDLNAGGSCPPPPGTFACGPLFCGEGTEFCQKVVGGAAGSPPRYSCLATPTECQPPTCDCLKMHSCGDMCAADAAGNFTLTCLAP